MASEPEYVLVPRADLQLARDLLTEKVQGGGARSPNHNARLVIDRLLSAAPVASEGEREPVALPADVVALVIAARYVLDLGDMSDEHRQLDRALMPFSSRVPYDDEPDASPAEPAPTVGVKALEWSKFYTKDGREYAETPTGCSYHASEEGWWFPLSDLNRCANKAEAKKAAQADWENRILSALKPAGERP